MKYIKKYENKLPKYSEGDIVLAVLGVITTNTSTKWNVLLVIKDIRAFGNNVTYGCYNFGDDEPLDESELFYIREKDIIKKFTEEEAKILIDSSKYNL